MRVSRLTMVLVVTILLLGAVPAIAGAASISGKVMSDGYGVGEAEVTVYNSDGEVEATVDSSNGNFLGYGRGNYSISGLNSGTYTISYEKAGYGLNWYDEVWLEEDAEELTLLDVYVPGYWSSNGWWNVWHPASWDRDDRTGIDLNFAQVPVVFHYNYDGIEKPEFVDAGDNLVAPPANRTGWVLEGWYRDIDLTDKWDFETDTAPAAPFNLYAKWVLRSYDVTFEVNEGSPVAAQYVPFGSYVMRPVDPTRAGYVFKGWYSDAGLNNPYDFSQSMRAGELVLYAKWATATYTVSFQSAGGITIPSVVVELNDTVELAEPAREGYKFLGWYDAPKNGSLVTSATPITSDIRLYAYWGSINPDLKGILVFTKLSNARVSGSTYNKTLKFYYATKVAVRKARTSSKMKVMYQIGDDDWKELSSLLLTVKPGETFTIRIKTVAADGTTSRVYTYDIVMVR